jgi:hypothetical protein
MSIWRFALTLLSFLMVGSAVAQDSLPFSDGENLQYSISYPSGLGLGKASLSAKRLQAAGGEPERWVFNFKLDAAIPGFAVGDHIQSITTTDLCSIRLRKEIVHGKRKAEERTRFDQEKGIAVRETLGGGGTSELEIPACASDALTFLYFLRSELSRGRVPPPRQVFFGAPYEVRFQPASTQQVTVGGEAFDADQLIVTAKGPVSETMFIMLVGRDPARTPVRITLPLEPGNFTMELEQE